jgi:hypothetical protein
VTNPWQAFEQEASRMSRFPCHGWATASFEGKFIWLPVRGEATLPPPRVPLPRVPRPPALQAHLRMPDPRWSRRHSRS